MSMLIERVGQGREGAEAIVQSENWPRVQYFCLSLTTYAAQHRDAFGQHPSFMSSEERAIARKGYDALLAEAQAEFCERSLEARYISGFAARITGDYGSGYGPK